MTRTDAPLAKQRVAGAKRRLEAGLVAVVEEKHVLRVFANERRLLLGERGSHRRDDFGDSREHQTNYVEVPFDDDEPVRLANRLLRPIQPVEQLPLGKDLGFGRVEILRLAVAEHPTAEADDVAGSVEDREHQAIAKARPRLRAVFANDQQAGVAADASSSKPRARERVRASRLIARRVADAEAVGVGRARCRATRDSRAPPAPAGVVPELRRERTPPRWR